MAIALCTACGCSAEGTSAFGSSSPDAGPRVGTAPDAGSARRDGGSAHPDASAQWSDAAVGLGASSDAGWWAAPAPDAALGVMMPVDGGAAVVGDAGTDRCAHRDSAEPVVLYLSADDSSSMASPAIARGQLLAGQRIAPNTLRLYELLNYYNVRYPEPEAGHIGIVPELRWLTENDELTVQIGLQARSREVPQGRVISPWSSTGRAR